MKNKFKSMEDYKIYTDSFRVLTQKEINFLLQKKIGPIEKEKIFKANLKLIPKIINQFDYKSFPLQKLIKAGESGLTRAVDHYGKKNGKYTLSSLATWWIRHYIKEAFPVIQFKKKKLTNINWDKVSLALYDSQKPYDEKVAEVRQDGKKLIIKVKNPELQEAVEREVKQIAKEKLEYNTCIFEKTRQGETQSLLLNTTLKGSSDYLIGLYYAVYDHMDKVNGISFSPRLLDENGDVVGRYGRRLKPLAKPMKSTEELQI